MLTHARLFPFASLPTCLAAGLAGALGATLFPAQAGEVRFARVPVAQGLASTFELPPYLRGQAAKTHAAFAHAHAQPTAPATHHVTSCVDDGGAGTLRSVVQSASTLSGDTIDLASQLPMPCSTITLGSEITVLQDTLYLQGPGNDALTIDGNLHSRIFEHIGSGTLSISDLTLANGYYTSNADSKGGCIYSSHDISLIRSVVSHCSLKSVGSGTASGGGIYAKDALALDGSTITESDAYSTNGFARGGGVFARNSITAKYSTIRNNTAYDNHGTCNSIAGGIAVDGGATIAGSTIFGNRSCGTGGLQLGITAATAIITNSTISRNFASNYDGAGGVWTNAPLQLANSTIAFNKAVGGTGGLHASYVALTLQSSIIATNTAANESSDLSGSGSASVVATSADNLIISSTLPLPAGTLQVCPQLEPLADNGGRTRTHALRHASPAIDHGNNAAGLIDDQRSAPRVAGAQADVGAVEWQPGEADERVFVNGFDGLCDQ